MPKDHLWKSFRLTIFFMPGCQIIATSSLLKACVSVYNRLGLALGILPESSAAIPKTDQYSINTKKKKNLDQVASPWSTKATWREILAGGQCWKGLLYKHRQLHKNGSSTRAGTMFDLLHCTKYTTISTITVLGIVLNEWTNTSDWGGLYLYPSVCYAYVKKNGLWSAGTFSNSISARDLCR